MRYKAIAAGIGAGVTARNGNSGCRRVSQTQLQHRRCRHDRYAGNGPNHGGQRIVCSARQGNTTLRVHEFVLTVSR
jgi:hypothetical protein